METTGIIGIILGLYTDYIGITRNMMGFYWHNGKENGNYSILG